MGSSAVIIDPQTGERVSGGPAVQIDPATGERIAGTSPAHGNTSQLGWRDRAIQYLTRPQEAQPTMLPNGQLSGPMGEDPMSYMGRRALGGVAKVVLHPVDTALGAANQLGDAFMAAAGDPQAQQTLRDQAKSLGHQLATDAPGTIMEMMGQGQAIGTAMKGAGKVASATVKKIAPSPEALYESALKPSTTVTPAERAEAVATGLKNEIPVSAKGLEKLGDLVENLNTKIKAVVDSDPTRTIDPTKVATRVDQVIPRYASQVNASEDLAALDASKQQFLSEQGARPGRPAVAPQPTGLVDAQGNPIMTAGQPAIPPRPAPPMSASDAQAMKQGTYRSLGSKVYGEQKAAQIEAQKTLARGLKEEIAGQFPELNGLNESESKLLNLQPLLEKAVSRNANKQLMGIGTPAAAGAAKAVSGSNLLAGAAATLKAMVDDPYIKSRLAIAISKGGKVPYSTALSRVTAYSASLGRTAQSPQESSDDQTPHE